ncbi:hypothetical protein D5F01_LYC23070 [Larimichthys crocea]|uniref:Ig-like domain-containing protein n=1 Tax=Larimichthys crocea TaxID=215358 RepID=A0A6G0HKC1_LARCR|nr:hypothetical protein D5F01_LYC23070 [Larimichthys crocea]
MSLLLSGAGCPDVIPNRLQHFEYQSISFNCEVLDGSLAWAVKRKSSSGNITCGTNWGVPEGSGCRIRDVYVEDSGEYWCETKDGKTSKSVNIAVTASVYKNGILMKNVTTGNLIINSVSKCDEGLYKCISRAGESPESWLSVKEFHQEPIPLCSDQLPVLLYFLMRTVGTVVWVAMLLLVLRKRHKDRKRKLYTVTYFIFSSTSVCCSESQRQDSMTVTALCGLLIDVLFLLTVQGQNYVHEAGGGVILESPALPVMEQQNVTLRCTLKGTSSNLPADFIKEGHMDMVTYKGEMTIYNVSKSDEGLYKCRISGRGESAGSWLAVRGHRKEKHLRDGRDC